MRLPKLWAPGLLLGIAFVLCIANLSAAALRTTIPRRIDGTVTHKAVLHEKHGYVDDVCLLTLDSSRTIHVDHAVFDTIAVGSRIAKARWSRSLVVGARTWRIPLSPDLRGMLLSMPLVLVVLTGLAVLARHPWPDAAA
jgi:hypothetical protein